MRELSIKENTKFTLSPIARKWWLQYSNPSCMTWNMTHFIHYITSQHSLGYAKVLEEFKNINWLFSCVTPYICINIWSHNIPKNNQEGNRKVQAQVLEFLLLLLLIWILTFFFLMLQIVKSCIMVLISKSYMFYFQPHNLRLYLIFSSW